MIAIRAILIGSILTAAGVQPAAAHAFLDQSEPRVGSTVHSAPVEVRLWFNQEIEPAFSTIRVSSAAGERVDNEDVKVEPANHSILYVSLKRLDHGRYTVKWRVVSVDTHVTEGDFSFNVAP